MSMVMLENSNILGKTYIDHCDPNKESTIKLFDAFENFFILYDRIANKVSNPLKHALIYHFINVEFTFDDLCNLLEIKLKNKRGHYTVSHCFSVPISSENDYDLTIESPIVKSCRKIEFSHVGDLFECVTKVFYIRSQMFVNRLGGSRYPQISKSEGFAYSLLAPDAVNRQIKKTNGKYETYLELDDSIDTLEQAVLKMEEDYQESLKTHPTYLRILAEEAKESV